MSKGSVLLLSTEFILVPPLEQEPRAKPFPGNCTRRKNFSDVFATIKIN
jgi:hypothetical protein